jgi:hypothetical protein
VSALGEFAAQGEADDIVFFMSRPSFAGRAGPVGDYLSVESFARRNPDVPIGVVRFGDPSSHVSLDGRRILIEQEGQEPIEVTSARAFVYFPFSFEPEETVLRPAKDWFHQQQWRAVTQYLECRLPQLGPCINVPAHARLSSNKLYQLAVAGEVGIASPRTLVASRRPSIERAQALLGDWIRKNVSEGDARLTRGVGSDCTDVGDCPWMVQEFLEGHHEFRVYVIGSAVFPIEVSRPLQTHRQPATPEYTIGEYTEAFIDVAKLVHRLGLKYAAVDCILVAEKPIVLEVNPNGSWQWLPTEIKRPVQDAFESLVLRMLRHPAEFTW